MTSTTTQKPGPGAVTPETGQVAEPLWPATMSLTDLVREAIEAVEGGQYVGERRSEILPANVSIPLPTIDGLTWVWVRVPVEDYEHPYKSRPKWRVRSSGFGGYYDHLPEDLVREAIVPVGTVGNLPGDLMRYGLADRSTDIEAELRDILDRGRVWQPMTEDDGPVTDDWALFGVDVTGISPALLPDSVIYDDGHPDRVVAVWWLAALVMVGSALRAVYQLMEVR